MAKNPPDQPERDCSKRARNTHRDPMGTVIRKGGVRTKASEEQSRDAANPVQNISKTRGHRSIGRHYGLYVRTPLIGGA